MYGGFRMSGWWIGGLGMYGGFRMSGWWIGGKSSVSQHHWSQLQRDTQHSKNGYFLVTLLDMLVMVCTSLPFTSLRPLPPPRSDVWAARGVPLAARGGGVPLASRRERSARSRSARSAMVPMVLCWRTAEPNWAKNYALGDQCNEANSIPCSCILFDTIPASTCVFGPLQTRFYQWVHIRLFSNERPGVYPQRSKSTHLWCKTVIPNLSDQKYGIGTCIWGDQISTLPIFTRSDQTKCPAKWDQISIAGLPIVKPQPQLFNIVSTKWHRLMMAYAAKRLQVVKAVVTTWSMPFDQTEWVLDFSGVDMLHAA